MSNRALETLLQEERIFPPPEAFRRQANVKDPLADAPAVQALEERYGAPG